MGRGAPGGANPQSWHFAVLSRPGTRREIHEAAEVEEREFHDHRPVKGAKVPEISRKAL